jgi:hypothetical protein
MGAASVAFQGERGAFSDEAAYALFSDEISVACGYEDFDALLDGVEKGEVHYDLLLEHEGVHRIEQCLIGGKYAVSAGLLCRARLPAGDRRRRAGAFDLGPKPRSRPLLGAAQAFDGAPAP